MGARFTVCAAAVCVAALSPGLGAAAPGPLTLELNRLEQMDGGCRVDLVVEGGAETLDVLTLDIVMFDPAGLIVRRAAVEVGPVPAGKRRVRAFLAEGISCDAIGSALVNGVLACTAGGAPVEGCGRDLVTRARGPVDLWN